MGVRGLLDSLKKLKDGSDPEVQGRAIEALNFIQVWGPSIEEHKIGDSVAKAEFDDNLKTSGPTRLHDFRLSFAPRFFSCLATSQVPLLPPSLPLHCSRPSVDKQIPAAYPTCALVSRG